MTGLAATIASEESLIEDKVVLGPKEICVVANVPSGMRRQFAGRQTTYKVLGPGGTYGKLTGLPRGGKNYGVTFATGVATLELAVEDIAIGDDFTVKRVDLKLGVQIDTSDGEFNAIREFMAEKGPGFLDALDPSLVRDVQAEVRRGLRAAKPEHLRGDGNVSVRALTGHQLLGGMFRIDEVYSAEPTFDAHFQKLLDARATNAVDRQTHELNLEKESRADEFDEQTHAYKLAAERRADERAKAHTFREQAGERELEEAKVAFAMRMAKQLGMPVMDYLEPDDRRLREEKVFDLVTGLIENLGKVRQSGGQAAVEKILGFIAASMPSLSPQAQATAAAVSGSNMRALGSADAAFDGEILEGTAFTESHDVLHPDATVRVDGRLARVLSNAGVDVKPWALGAFSQPTGPAVLLALPSTPRPKERAEIRAALRDEGDLVLLAPIDSLESLMLAFVINYAPLVQDALVDARCEFAEGRVTLVLVGGDQPLRPLLRDLLDPRTHLLNGLRSVVPDAEVDIAVAAPV